MKKIIIVTHKLVTGGVEKALIEMLKNIKLENCDITLMIRDRGGILESEIPDDVEVKGIFDNEIAVKEKIIKSIKNFKIIQSTKLSYYLLSSYFAKNTFQSYNSISKTLPMLDEEYDLAICYNAHFSFPVIYTINNIKAKNKLMWVHTESGYYKDLVYRYKKYYDKYDHIFAVSKDSANDFIKLFPEIKNKISVFYNSIYDKDIQLKSLEYEVFNDQYRGIRIVTVGRLCKEKGYDIAIKVTKRLLDEGYDIKWYCIGEGEERNYLKNEIRKNNIEDSFILLGNKANPYPYIQKSDIYVQPSRTEGYCITLAEARCLHKPIISTNFMGAKEQIIDRKTGVLVSCNEKEIYNSIKELVEDVDLRNELVNNLRNEIIDTRDEVKKLYKFM